MGEADTPPSSQKSQGERDKALHPPQQLAADPSAGDCSHLGLHRPAPGTWLMGLHEIWGRCDGVSKRPSLPFGHLSEPRGKGLTAGGALSSRRGSCCVPSNAEGSRTGWGELAKHQEGVPGMSDDQISSQTMPELSLQAAGEMHPGGRQAVSNY